MNRSKSESDVVRLCNGNERDSAPAAISVTSLTNRWFWRVTISWYVLCNCKCTLWLLSYRMCMCDVFSKSSAHDEEVRKLYEEMEQQIKVEKERILNEVSFAPMFVFRNVLLSHEPSLAKHRGRWCCSIPCIVYHYIYFNWSVFVRIPKNNQICTTAKWLLPLYS